MPMSIIIWGLIAIVLTLTAYLIIKYIRDIQNNTLYHALEQTKVNGILLNNSNKITRITDSACELLELERFETIGKHASNIFDHKDKYQITLLLKELEDQHFKLIDNISIKTKTGQCHVLCKLSRVDSIFRYHHKMIILQDRTNIINYIKKIEQSEQQLKEYSNLFRSSFEDSFLPSVIIKSNGSITNYNKSFHSLLRKQKIELNQDLLYDLLNIDKYTFNEELKKNYSFEMSAEVTGQKRSFVFNLHKISTSGNNEYILCQIQDISRQKQSEELRKKLEKQVKQTRKVEYLGELASIISHEFNNALMPIISFTTAVEKSLPDEFTQEKDKLKKVISASDHAKQMINQIMAIKHIDFHEKEDVDLNELIERNLPKFNIPSNIKLTIKNNIKDTLTSGNYEVLGTALCNIVSNSVQAMNDSKGKIIFDLEKVSFSKHPPKSLNNHNIKANKNYIKFSIIDNGPGIEQDDIISIFNPFFTTKHFNKQIGTGLTYVYNCMDKYSVPLIIANNPNGGVSITAFFPQI